MVKILVAEDDKDINGIVCASLINGGYEPCACFS